MSNFIVDLFKNLDKDNKKLREYLSINCRKYTIAEARKLSEYHLNVIRRIDDILCNPATPVALLNTADGMLSFRVRQWVQVVYALRHEIVTVYISYSQFVAAVKAYEDDLVDRVIKAPFLILEYPELVTNADWARGKLLDAVQNKKNMLIVTSDFSKVKKIFGDVVANTLNSMGIAIVDMRNK